MPARAMNDRDGIASHPQFMLRALQVTACGSRRRLHFSQADAIVQNGAMRVTAITAALLVACGSPSRTSVGPSVAPSVAAVTPRAPSCEWDKAYNDIAREDQPRDAWRVFELGKRPAYIVTDPEFRHIYVRDLETNAQLTELTVPAPEGMDVTADDVLVTPAGPLVFVTGSLPAKNQGDLAVTSGYWLVPLDRAGKPGAAITLPLPAAYGWEITLIAVGDYRVAHMVVPNDLPEFEIGEDIPYQPEESHLVILDRGGNVVKSAREVDVANIVGVGDGAFAALFSDKKGFSTGVRVFDLARGDWAGPLVQTGFQVMDVIAVGDRALLAGTPRTHDRIPDEFPISLASVRATGEVSPWKPVDGKVTEVTFAPAVEPGLALLMTTHPIDDKRSAMQITAVNAELAMARAPGRIEPPPMRGTSTLTRPEAIYMAAWGRVQRIACRP